MTVERYNTPNHPRWYPRTNGRPTEDAASRPQQGRSSPPRANPSPLVSREATGDDTTIELRDAPGGTSITTELPDRSVDDVRVSVSGASVRIRAPPSDASPPSDGIDRTITLSESVDPADVVVAYREPVLTVIVPHENQ